LIKYKLIDSHCHLFSEEFDTDRVEVLNAAYNEGVIAVISSSLGAFEIHKAINEVETVQEKTKTRVLLSFGHSPTNLSEKEINETINLIEKEKNMMIAVGEVGLDFYYIREHVVRDTQIKYFKKFIDVSKRNDLPVIVHSRSAGKYAIEILSEEKAERVLLHAFDGSYKSAKKAIKYGYYFSIPTSIMYSQQKRKLVEKLPIENILLETDSPVLAPIRGTRNEPKNLKYALMEIAKIKDISVSNTAEAILNNTIRLFGISF